MERLDFPPGQGFFLTQKSISIITVGAIGMKIRMDFEIYDFIVSLSAIPK